jgi:exonuclease SbcC
MNLEQIDVHNFGSFHDATIDLRPIQAAVITGENGAGKSTAFIDAPLAALFGRCRTDMDRMIRLGTDEMRVAVTFQANGARYRVIRKRSTKTKAGKSELALQVEADGAWTDASGARIADTQEKIHALLNLDYDLMTSTGLLVQGQADRFTRATPGERKSLLAQILQLDTYAQLKTAAGRQQTVANTKAEVAGQRYPTLLALGSTADDLQRRRDEHHPKMAELETTILQLEERLSAETTVQARLAARADQATTLPAKLQGLKDRIGVLTAQQVLKNNALHRATKIQTNRAVINAKLREEQANKARLVQLDERRNALQNDAIEWNLKIHTARLTQADRLKLQTQIETAKAAVDRERHIYDSDTGRLVHDRTRDEQTSALLTQVPCDENLQARCQFTIQAIEAKKRIPQLQRQIDERAGLGATITTAASAALEALQLTERSEYDGWDFEGEIKGYTARLQAIAKEQDVVEVDRRATLNELTQLATFTVLAAELAQADRDIEALNCDLDHITAALRDLQKEEDAAKLELLAATEASREHKDQLVATERTRRLIAAARIDLAAATKLVAQLEELAATALKAAQEAIALKEEISRHWFEAAQYERLGAAYGQIPTMILETAIPLVETEANALLQRLSSAGLQVTIQTQKTVKSRDGLAETLDITVRDCYGERTLENYSGGERARVDLAIRIGLSRLLATRAGARLETLIVDEAFAAVDRAGVDQLIETLPALTKEFRRLLFITHDESFKTAVGHRISVRKSAQGSTIEIEG